MTSMTPARAPWHLWVVAVIATLWNAMGTFDYTATQFRLDFYMSSYTEEQLDYFYGFPAWYVALWATAVWSAFIASLLLFVRTKLAYWLFVLSFITMAANFGLGYALGMQVPGANTFEMLFTVAIVVIALLLLLYSRAMAKRGVLR